MWTFTQDGMYEPYGNQKPKTQDTQKIKEIKPNKALQILIGHKESKRRRKKKER